MAGLVYGRRERYRTLSEAASDKSTDNASTKYAGGSERVTKAIIQRLHILIINKP
jgi:hypothetical protein